MQNSITGDFLIEYARNFEKDLLKVKGANHLINWYPYGILNNFIHIQEMLNVFPMEKLLKGEFIDIGAADGDLSFLLTTLGFGGRIIEYPPTNYNQAIGVQYLNQHFNNPVQIELFDIDQSSKSLRDTGKTYSLTFFLGTLYHLKNPVQVLENLSWVTEHLILSTRVARFAKDIPIHNLKVAYLLGPDEANNDSTNWWIFTVPALQQLFERTGWEIQYSKIGRGSKAF